MELTGRSALICGGARGLGARIATALASQGCDIALLDDAGGTRSTIDYSLAGPDDLAAVIAEIEATGRRVVTANADVREYDSVGRAIAEITDQMPDIDIVVVAAHVTSVVEAEQMSDAHWDEVLDTNLHGAFHVVQNIWPRLLARPGSRVVFLVPLEARSGGAFRSHTSAAGWATLGLMKTLAAEGGASGVAVNAVCVSATDSPAFRSPRELAVQAGLAPSASITQDEAEHAMRVRNPTDVALVDPVSVADAVLFLVSQPTTGMTGSVIEISQGMSTSNAT